MKFTVTRLFLGTILGFLLWIFILGFDWAWCPLILVVLTGIWFIVTALISVGNEKQEIKRNEISDMFTTTFGVAPHKDEPYKIAIQKIIDKIIAEIARQYFIADEAMRAYEPKLDDKAIWVAESSVDEYLKLKESLDYFSSIFKDVSDAAQACGFFVYSSIQDYQEEAFIMGSLPF